MNITIEKDLEKKDMTVVEDDVDNKKVSPGTTSFQPSLPPAIEEELEPSINNQISPDTTAGPPKSILENNVDNSNVDNSSKFENMNIAMLNTFMLYNLDESSDDEDESDSEKEETQEPVKTQEPEEKLITKKGARINQSLSKVKR